MVMKIIDWYKDNFEASLSGRYLTLNHIENLLDSYSTFFDINVAGTSENDFKIPIIRLGTGTKKVLVWSQMHGNESTTTKAIFDFLKLISYPGIFLKEVEIFLKSYSFTIIPILNPDGAKLNTRENANEVDLNRDAKNLSQKESRVLRKVFEELKPDLCLNMHDQRSIFGLNGKFPATISFLAPAANKKRTITPARVTAISYINRSIDLLVELIPDNIGRFDDGYNDNCVGDFFTTAGVPTILFEAGHINDDYEREVSRSYIFYALAAMFNISHFSEVKSKEHYFKIPENEKIFNDVVLNNVYISNEKPSSQICLQYREVLTRGKVTFELVIDSINEKNEKLGHQTFNLEGGSVLINSQEKLHIGKKVTSIFDKRNNLMLI
ncbi:peptidase M14 [Patiriisocius marinistellae]|uniref:Peptidase M14 n=2 Tax=Patiriisocius marinistellae TaxID=2494560 RepID=A0A5J4G1R4_9FLAO|nr:peptidase M14 [Patiriisocius marinistellae]